MERAVDLPVSPAGACNAPSLPLCANPPQLDEPLENLLLRLLPVRSARELLIGLAKTWLRGTGADAVVVGVMIQSLSKNLVAHVCVDEMPRLTESSFKPSGWIESPDEAIEVLSSGLGACVGSASAKTPVASFPLRISADAWGCVVLTSRGGRDPDPGSCGQLCAWSGPLLEQAVSTERQRDIRIVLESEKAAAIAEFAAGAGHEINNPLATIAGRVQVLLREETDPNRRQHLATIGAQALRVRDMIGDLMLFARPPAPVLQRLSLEESIRLVADRFVAEARVRSCTVRVECAEPVFTRVDPTQLQVVASEFLRNALEAAEPPGEICVRLESATIDGACYAVLSVTDDGAGLTEKDRVHAFDPYYSGRDAGRGLGFGLCKCWRIVANHGGWIDVASIPDVATTFRSFWPVESDRPGSGRPAVE